MAGIYVKSISGICKIDDYELFLYSFWSQRYTFWWLRVLHSFRGCWPPPSSVVAPVLTGVSPENLLLKGWDLLTKHRTAPYFNNTILCERLRDRYLETKQIRKFFACIILHLNTGNLYKGIFLNIVRGPLRGPHQCLVPGTLLWEVFPPSDVIELCPGGVAGDHAIDRGGEEGDLAADELCWPAY